MKGWMGLQSLPVIKVPYGYNLDETGHLVVNRAEQKVIRVISDLHQKGYSIRVICLELEEKGHLTKTAKISWNPKKVSMIIRRASIRKKNGKVVTVRSRGKRKQ